MSAANHSPAAATSERSPLLGSKSTTSSDAPEHGKGSPRIADEKTRVPQTIAHRGFSAIAPENSMAAFEAAAAAGVEAIETDLHLTRDDVIVLSHDGTLQRCFGNSTKVRDLTWTEISQFRTVEAPHQPMLRLVDLLEFLDQPGREDIWLMLDIKTDDDPERMMQRIAQTLASAPGKKPWNTRITPCCWNATYIKYSMKYLPEYRVTHLGFSIMYARCLVDIPNISFSLMRQTLATPLGARFLRDMKQLGIPVYAWTLDEEKWMEWAVLTEEVSGVITDEIDLYHQTCDRIRNGGAHELSMRNRGRASGSNSLFRTVRLWGGMAWFQLLVVFYMTKEWLKYGSPSRRVKKALSE
ncbi:PLC-like phosphodiesterase [Xylaria intraflava]|nr:PLC-like phosphodiesterase [Xylaria intraflava]